MKQLSLNEFNKNISVPLAEVNSGTPILLTNRNANYVLLLPVKKKEDLYWQMLITILDEIKSSPDMPVPVMIDYLCLLDTAQNLIYGKKSTPLLLGLLTQQIGRNTIQNLLELANMNRDTVNDVMDHFHRNPITLKKIEDEIASKKNQ